MLKKNPAFAGFFAYFRDLLLLLDYHWYPYAAPTIASFLPARLDAPLNLIMCLPLSDKRE